LTFALGIHLDQSLRLGSRTLPSKVMWNTEGVINTLQEFIQVDQIIQCGQFFSSWFTHGVYIQELQKSFLSENPHKCNRREIIEM